MTRGGGWNEPWRSVRYRRTPSQSDHLDSASGHARPALARGLRTRAAGPWEGPTMAMTKVRHGHATRSLFKPLSRTAARAPKPTRSAVIDWAAYIDGTRVDTATLAEAVAHVRAPA